MYKKARQPACSGDDLVSREKESVVPGVSQLKAVHVGDIRHTVGPVQTVP
jgi:hypothetical protein